MADAVRGQAQPYFNGKTHAELEAIEEALEPIQGLLPPESAYVGDVYRP